MGMVRIQIRFRGLGLVIHVYFVIVCEEVPTLRSMKYMVQKKLDISVLGKYLSHGSKRQSLSM